MLFHVFYSSYSENVCLYVQTNIFLVAVFFLNKHSEDHFDFLNQ